MEWATTEEGTYKATCWMSAGTQAPPKGPPPSGDQGLPSNLLNVLPLRRSERKKRGRTKSKTRSPSKLSAPAPVDRSKKMSTPTTSQKKSTSSEKMGKQPSTDPNRKQEARGAPFHLVPLELLRLHHVASRKLLLRSSLLDLRPLALGLVQDRRQEQEEKRRFRFYQIHHLHRIQVHLPPPLPLPATKISLHLRLILQPTQVPATVLLNPTLIQARLHPTTATPRRLLHGTFLWKNPPAPPTLAQTLAMERRRKQRRLRRRRRKERRRSQVERKTTVERHERNASWTPSRKDTVN